MCGRDNKIFGSFRQSLDSSILFNVFRFVDLSESPACVRDSSGSFLCANKKFISYFNSNADCSGLTIDSISGLDFDAKVTLSSLELSCDSLAGITSISHDVIIMSRLWDVRIESFSFNGCGFYLWQFSPAYYSVFSATSKNISSYIMTNELCIEALLTPREKEVLLLCVIYGFSKDFVSRNLCVSSRTIDGYLYFIKKKILKTHSSLDEFMFLLISGDRILKMNELAKTVLKSFHYGAC